MTNEVQLPGKFLPLRCAAVIGQASTGLPAARAPLLGPERKDFFSLLFKDGVARGAAVGYGLRAKRSSDRSLCISKYNYE